MHTNILAGSRRTALLAALIGWIAAPAALAGTIDYTGPGIAPGGMSGWMGTDVWYAGVSEANTEGTGGSDGMTGMLFGAPASVTGNSIDFNPTNFQADSSGGGADIVDSQLSFMVIAKQGQVIDNLQFSEAGDTTIAGAPSTDATLSVVTMDVFIDVVDIDGQAVVGAPINIMGDMTFTPSDGDYFLNTDSGGGNFFQTAWTGTLNIDIAAELDDLGVSYDNGATKLSVTLDNTLTAVSIDGTSSFIKKKDFDGLIITSNVPEPTTALLAALASIGFIARRR